MADPQHCEVHPNFDGRPVVGVRKIAGDIIVGKKNRCLVVRRTVPNPACVNTVIIIIITITITTAQQ